jgi:hypothetical protein
MGLRSVDAAGIGPSAQVDHPRDLHLDALNVPFLNPPRIPVDDLEGHRRTQQAANQWAAQEHIQRGRGSLWEKGDLGKWSTFEGGRPEEPEHEPSRASIEIDADQGRRKQPKTTVAEAAAVQEQARAQLRQTAGGPSDTPSWRRIRDAHITAALGEEQNLETIQPFMGSAPKRSGRNRRRVTLGA